MALSFISSTTGSALNGGNITLSLPTASMVANDFVLIISGAFGRAGTEGRIGNALSYTQIVDVLDGTSRQRCRVAWKAWPSSDGASVTVEGSGNASDATTAVAFVFRGQDLTTPIDVTTTTATASSTNPDPPSITPSSNDCAIFASATSAVVDATPGTITSYTEPAAFTANANDTNPSTTAAAYRLLSGGGGSGENPAAFSSWGSGAWVAVTVAIRPLVAFVFKADNGFDAPRPLLRTLPGFGFDTAPLSTILPVPYKPTTQFDPPRRLPPVVNDWAAPPPAPARPIFIGPQFDPPAPKRAPPLPWTGLPIIVPPAAFVGAPFFDAPRRRAALPGFDFTPPPASAAVQATFTFYGFQLFDRPVLRQPAPPFDWTSSKLSTVLPVAYRPLQLFEPPPPKREVPPAWGLTVPAAVVVTPLPVLGKFFDPPPTRVGGQVRVTWFDGFLSSQVRFVTGTGGLPKWRPLANTSRRFP